jgi:hypothetical protein
LGFPHVRVGHRQAYIQNAPTSMVGAFFLPEFQPTN